jgi:hypothetical protein
VEEERTTRWARPLSLRPRPARTHTTRARTHTRTYAHRSGFVDLMEIPRLTLSALGCRIGGYPLLRPQLSWLQAEHSDLLPFAFPRAACEVENSGVQYASSKTPGQYSELSVGERVGGRVNVYPFFPTHSSPSDNDLWASTRRQTIFTVLANQFRKSVCFPTRSHLPLLPFTCHGAETPAPSRPQSWLQRPVRRGLRGWARALPAGSGSSRAPRASRPPPGDGRVSGGACASGKDGGGGRAGRNKKKTHWVSLDWKGRCRHARGENKSESQGGLKAIALRETSPRP